MKNKKIIKQRQEKNQIRANLRQETYEPSHLALRFSPTAWAKLLYFRDKADNEVGGFGITESDDLLFVKDFVTVKQRVTIVSVSFEDESVADLFDVQVDLGRKPEQFARIWCHTHPGSLPEPSITDEETFQRVFGKCQWSVMFILAQDNKTYARLSFNVGPGGQVLIPVRIDYGYEFGSSNQQTWDAEYESNVMAEKLSSSFGSSKQDVIEDDFGSAALPYDFVEELEEMSPAERQVVLDELAARPELWDEESEVMLL